MSEVPSAWKSVPLSSDEIRAVVSGMQAYYDDRAPEYDDWYRHINVYDDPENNERWHAEVATMTEWVKSFSSGRLLEIASGTGWWTRHLARRADVVTLDYAPAMIAMLRRRLQAERVRAMPTRGDAYLLPFAAASFDCCFFGFWLSHVPQELLTRFFGEVTRVVRQGGEVLIVDSNPFRGEAAGEQLKQERILNDGSRHQIVKVYHTPQSLKQLLEQFGDDVQTWTSGNFFTAGMFKGRGVNGKE
ncbi:MAG: class I SAM-dependent methyltransferase [Chloroflexi bacterium]|nr:class I SAM-dependent methyltransferase [Chloroflexota bacterium]